jgi:hypothetical protein
VPRYLDERQRAADMSSDCAMYRSYEGFALSFFELAGNKIDYRTRDAMDNAEKYQKRGGCTKIR